MYDKYDSPSDGEEEGYEESPVDKAQATVSELLEIAKPHAPAIIVAVAAVIVLFFAYDFFIGSVMNVEFTLNDSEGSQIDGAIKVSSDGGQEIKTILTWKNWVSTRRAEDVYTLTSFQT